MTPFNDARLKMQEQSHLPALYVLNMALSVYSDADSEDI